jgi:membrane associated rhomboid family serine protease
MIPIADENQRGYFPFVNYLFLIANVLVFFFVQPNTESAARTFYDQFGLIPNRLVEHPFYPGGYISVFSSMFLHGSLIHLAGNMLYLWIFGDNIEYVMGHIRYFFFYLIVGMGAAAGQIIIEPSSTTPMVGASGAISGILGAYLLKFPRNRVSILFFFIIIIRVIKVPAVIVLTIWFGFQVMNGYFHLNQGLTSGVAWFAHIGGFVSGFILVKIFEIYPKRK